LEPAEVDRIREALLPLRQESERASRERREERRLRRELAAFAADFVLQAVR
jgi:hypothetical protein